MTSAQVLCIQERLIVIVVLHLADEEVALAAIDIAVGQVCEELTLNLLASHFCWIQISRGALFP